MWRHASWLKNTWENKRQTTRIGDLWKIKSTWFTNSYAHLRKWFSRACSRWIKLNSTSTIAVWRSSFIPTRTVTLRRRRLSKGCNKPWIMPRSRSLRINHPTPARVMALIAEPASNLINLTWDFQVIKMHAKTENELNPHCFGVGTIKFENWRTSLAVTCGERKWLSCEVCSGRSKHGRPLIAWLSNLKPGPQTLTSLTIFRRCHLPRTKFLHGTFLDSWPFWVTIAVGCFAVIAHVCYFDWKDF